MKSIKEKQLLVKWSRAMNETIDPALIEEVERYNQIQKDIIESVRSNTIKDLQEASVVAEKFVEKISIEYPKPPTLEEVLAVIKEETNELVQTQAPEAPPTQEAKPFTLAELAVDQITKSIKEEQSFQQPNPAPVDKNLEAIQKKLKFLEQAIGKIAATGPGGGEVNLRWLDDVARETIADGRYLKYNDTTKKFEFDDINPHEVVFNTTLVEEATYSVTSTDYYVGVNYAGNVTITLPTTPDSGRIVVIKDESGNCSINPITVVGNVDNDPGGFILQMDNGGIQMIYRSGWRVI